MGLVLPSRNRPHSGWPLSAQPFSARDSARMSDHPIGWSGQPSASAIGRGMAITRGVFMNDTGSVAIAGLPAVLRRWFRI